MEKLHRMEQLEIAVETLKKEKTELLQRIQGAEECLRSICQEKNSLKLLIADLQSERDIMTQNMIHLSKTIEKMVEANLELQEHLRATTGFTKGCHEILRAKTVTFSDKSTQLSNSQEKTDAAAEEANQKLEKLAAELKLQTSEKERLLTEDKWRKENLQQVVMDNAYLKKVVSVLWDSISSLKLENDHLRHGLVSLIEKEVAVKLPIMEKKKENIERLALNLKRELEKMKALTEKTRPQLQPANTALVIRLQAAYEQANINVCCLLDEVKYYFPVWFKDSRDYYVHISKCSTDLLQENIRYLKLLVETPSLKKADQWCEKFKMSIIPALREKLNNFLENILQDVSNLEHELLALEAKVKELETSHKRRKQYMASCAVVFCVQDFEKGIRNDTKNLHALLDVLKSKSQALTKARSEVVAKHACISWEAEAVMGACRKNLEDQSLEQQMQKDLGARAAEVAARELEEVKKLEHNLSTVEQDMTAQLDAAIALEKEEIEKLTDQNVNGKVA